MGPAHDGTLAHTLFVVSEVSANELITKTMLLY